MARALIYKKKTRWPMEQSEEHSWQVVSFSNPVRRVLLANRDRLTRSRGSSVVGPSGSDCDFSNRKTLLVKHKRRLDLLQAGPGRTPVQLASVRSQLHASPKPRSTLFVWLINHDILD